MIFLNYLLTVMAENRDHRFAREQVTAASPLIVVGARVIAGAVSAWPPESVFDPAVLTSVQDFPTHV